MIIMDSVIIPRPPALPPPPLIDPLLPKCPPSSFHLQDDTNSVYSIYKQKIDSMFTTDSSSDSSPISPNSVQARIEKMFTEVAATVPAPPPHSFSVAYLGSVTILDKVTSLTGLQRPLRELYFAYCKLAANPKPKSLTGRLEISNQGLRIKYVQNDKGLELMNSFPTIAVWSAVKFVIQEGTYAFLPLITDPDNIDKRTLFRRLNEQEAYVRGSTHAPLFAVVMRKFGVQKQLECHGFVCQTSEDAIVIAATLYKALMAHMSAKEKKPKSRNGVHCVSIASSCNEMPVRPPRVKKSVSSSVTSEETPLVENDDRQALVAKAPNAKKSVKTRRAPRAPTDFDAILPYEEPVGREVEGGRLKSFSDKVSTYMSREQKQITAEIKQVMSEGGNRGLKHVEGKEEGGSVRGKEQVGDILTKVTIPRSGSFLNAGGLTRYKTKVSRSNGQATGGSPLGFNELFNEFRLQEGLHSMDEILGAIIDPDGMSFNDLKPIYKEFLLKLSVTLTKDELYQRSKSIMRRQHKKKLQQARKRQPTRFATLKIKRLKRIFKRRRPRPAPPPKPPPVESSISSCSYDTHQFAPKQAPHAPKPPNVSTSEESDFFSVRRKLQTPQSNANRNSSSGYVSCSECSYDSDSCTCTSADKCYCSLGAATSKHLSKKALEKYYQASFCECDTDSCAESNKCYCQVPLRVAKEGVGGGTKHKRLCKRASNTKSTQSVEYVHNPTIEAYYEKLKSIQATHKRRGGDTMALDYELFTIQQQKQAKQASMRSYTSSKYSRSSKNGRSTCSEALSVKKSAEIAALFADIKLSQTTDIGNLMRRRANDALVSSRNAYNRLKTADQFNAKAPNHHHYQMLASCKNGKGGMYSARNGLYTIQSQSDESRRSSVSDHLQGRQLSANLENSLGYLP